MAYNYDELYKTTPWALGEPTQVFVKHFAGLERFALRVLDVGCGQGRDAVFIAKMGHSVVGVDMSSHGISALNDMATKGKLRIKGIVADIRDYAPDGMFDVILIDRTLHMLRPPEQVAVLTTLLGHVAEKGQVLIADEASNISGFESALDASPVDWAVFYKKGGTLFVSRD